MASFCSSTRRKAQIGEGITSFQGLAIFPPSHPELRLAPHFILQGFFSQEPELPDTQSHKSAWLLP